MSKPILISGIQPTGKLHLGNYLGALKNFVELQNSGKYNCYFFVADLHSLTEDFDPKEKPGQVLDLAADFLAAGLDPKKSTIFIQSQITAHSELAWILNTVTPMGELMRMTQFKEKAEISESLEALTMLLKNKKNDYKIRDLIKEIAEEDKISISEDDIQRLQEILVNTIVRSNVQTEKTNVGLFSYPVLMAADILLYDARFVPVGEDQLQHLELTRTLARKFNNKFGKTFIEPKAILTEVPRLMSLDNPTKKMSKSQPAGCIFLSDSPKTIQEKLARAVTDSGREIKYDLKNKAAVSNLLTIYSALSGKPIKILEEKYSGKGYAEFKKDLAKVISDSLKPFQKSKLQSAKIKSVLKAGAKKAGKQAQTKIKEIKKKIGLI